METERNGRIKKKVYISPQLVVHGTVAEITASAWSCDRFGKEIGYGDGYVLNIVPISACS